MTDPIVTLLGDWAATLTVGALALRIVLSVILSAIIGCERSSKRHSAGLRTFMLVSLVSTVAMIVDKLLIADATGGIYVLSAATIIGCATISVNSMLFSSRNQIKGLTTSVGLWANCLLGLCVGAGYYTISLIIFVVLICCLYFFPSFEVYLKNRSNHFEIHLELTSSAKLCDFVTTIRELGLTIDDIETNPAYVNSGLSVYSVAISISSEELKKYKTHNEIIEALKTLDYVYFIEEMRG